MSPGDLVVCVDVGALYGANNDPASLARLTIGDVYTVKDIHESKRKCGFRVRLYEVQSNSGWWAPERFRPCRKTNIDALIACTKVRETEECLDG